MSEQETGLSPESSGLVQTTIYLLAMSPVAYGPSLAYECRHAAPVVARTPDSLDKLAGHKVQVRVAYRVG